MTVAAAATMMRMVESSVVRNGKCVDVVSVKTRRDRRRKEQVDEEEEEEEDVDEQASRQALLDRLDSDGRDKTHTHLTLLYPSRSPRPHPLAWETHTHSQ